LLSIGTEFLFWQFDTQKYKDYKIILPAVLYGYETCPLTLREKSTLRVFQNRSLRKIFGLQREEVTLGW